MGRAQRYTPRAADPHNPFTLVQGGRGKPEPDVAHCKLCGCKLSKYRAGGDVLCMPCVRVAPRGGLPRGFVVNDYQKRVMADLGPEGWEVEDTREGAKLVALHRKTGSRVMIHSTPKDPTQSRNLKVGEARRRVALAESTAGRFVDWLRREYKVPADGFVEERISIGPLSAQWLARQSDSHLMPNPKALQDTLRQFGGPGTFEIVKSWGRGGSDVRIYGKDYVLDEGAPVLEKVKRDAAKLADKQPAAAAKTKLRSVATEIAGKDLCGQAVAFKDGATAVCDDVSGHVGMHSNSLQNKAWRECEVRDPSRSDLRCHKPVGHDGPHHDLARAKKWDLTPQEPVAPVAPVAPPKPADALASVTPVAPAANGVLPGLPEELVEQIRVALFATERKRLATAEEHAAFMLSMTQEFVAAMEKIRAAYEAFGVQLAQVTDQMTAALDVLGEGAEAKPVEGDPRPDAAAVHAD